MKAFFKRTVHAVLSFIILATALAACSNSFASDEKEQGTFTIIIGNSNTSASNSRAAYPPNIGGSNPGNPEISELEFEVMFTPLGGGTVKTFTATGNSTIKGNVDTGHYKVTLNVYTASDNEKYARGVATNNPVEIKSANNTIYVDVYNAANAEPPVVNAKPKNAAYTVGATAAPLTVAASVTDGGSLSYQWYSNTANNNTSGSAISGATTASYTPPTTTVGTTY